MSERVSDRHEGEIGGLLRPFDRTLRSSITVVVESAYAMTPASQHTAWMLINILARMAGIVDAIGLVCPPFVGLLPRVVPLASGARYLDKGLLTAAAEIGIVPVTLGATYDDRLVVGPGPAGPARVWGQGWWGAVSVEGIGVGESSVLPFGPYIAATLAGAEVFKAARDKDREPGPRATYLSAWHLRGAAARLPGGPASVDLSLSATIAGVGAVGSTAAHALWSTPGVVGDVDLVDDDQKGVDATNLNRYPLFGRASLGRQKASEAKRLLSDSEIRWHAFDSAVRQMTVIRPRVLSAVDRNDSRREIQLRYPPRILSASTRDLRAELTRCGPPGVGTCLSCFNPVERAEADEDLRDRVRRMTPDERRAKGIEVGLSEAEMSEFVATGKCGESSDRLMANLRAGPPLPEFAVSFMAVLAGTILAAELLKDLLDSHVALGDRNSNFKAQLWRPAETQAREYARDPSCPYCAPGIATTIWSERFSALGPARRS